MSAADRQMLLAEFKGETPVRVEESLGGHASVDGSDQGRPNVVAASHGELQERVGTQHLIAHEVPTCLGPVAFF